MTRYAALVAKQEISQQQYDQSVAKARAAAQAVEADRATVLALAQQIAQARDALDQAQSNAAAARTNAGRQVQVQRATVKQRGADVTEALAKLAQAQLNLSYTKIYAPADGVVGRKTVEVGARVQPGQDLMAVVELRDIWVTADYKETQLKQMRPGQAVTVHVDTYDRDYDAYIESMPAATGAEFSLLPPENATGNYVKVVQRLPVRIRFKNWYSPDSRLRPGMSVETKAWLK
jgi:membrane fusion protein (multidrug efflux system)